MRIAKLILQSNITSKKPGFSLVELLAAIGILVSFLAVSLVAFTSTQKLSEETQQSTVALQAAKAKLEEIRAMDFSGLKEWYEQTGPDVEDFDNDGDFTETTQINNRFTLYDSVNNKYGIGTIVITDVYDDDPDVEQLWLGAHDDFPAGDAGNDNWIEAKPDDANGWSARYSHASVVFDNKIWVLGGMSGLYFNDVWYSEDGATWTQVTTVAPMWSSRDRHTAVVFDNKIWILGGMRPSTSLSDVWSSPDGITWTEETSSTGWGERSSHTSVVFDSKIWVLGGTTGNYVSDVWSSPDGITWTEETSSAGWSARYSHASVVFDNKIWVLGGKDFSGFFDDVWYSEDGATWTQVTTVGPMWDPRGNHAAAVLGGRICVLGGFNGTYFNDVWYSEDGATWTEATLLTGGNERVSHASVVFGGKIWVLGGGVDGFFSNDVWWSYGPNRMYQVDVIVSWRQRSGRIIGEDDGEGGGMALDGIINGSEDVDADGILDSTVHVTGLIARRGYPSHIYMGKE